MDDMPKSMQKKVGTMHKSMKSTYWQSPLPTVYIFFTLQLNSGAILVSKFWLWYLISVYKFPAGVNILRG